MESLAAANVKVESCSRSSIAGVMRKEQHHFTFKLGEGDFQRAYSYPLPQVHSLAKSLGMDLKQDKEFIWFLKEALVAILPKGLPSSTLTPISSDTHPLIGPYRAAYAKLLDLAMERKTVLVSREERRMSMRQKRLEPIEIVTLQTKEEQETSLLNMNTAIRKKIDGLTNSDKLANAISEIQRYYEVALGSEEAVEEYKQTQDYKQVEPRAMLQTALTFGLGRDVSMLSLARVLTVLPLPPLWKVSIDAFHTPVYTQIYYNISTTTHPIRHFIKKLIGRFARKTEEVTMSFMDEAGREYAVDLRNLVSGEDYVLRVGQTPKVDPNTRSALSHKKAKVEDVLTNAMKLEITEQAYPNVFTDVHLLALAFAHFDAETTLERLSSWEFRFTSATEKYWYQPQTQRASKSYPYRQQLKQILVSMSLYYFRRFGHFIRDKNELPGVLSTQTSEIITEIRFEASQLMFQFLLAKLENREINSYSLSNSQLFSLFDSSNPFSLHDTLYCCPFRLLSPLFDTEDIDLDYVSEEESLGIVEAEDVKDMLEDIKQDVPASFSHLAVKKHLLSGVKQPLIGARRGQKVVTPRPKSRNTGSGEPESPVKANQYLQGIGVRSGRKRPTFNAKMTGESAIQVMRVPTVSGSQSSVLTLPNVTMEDEEGEETAEIEEERKAIPPPPPIPNKAETNILSDTQISVLKSLREKLNLPSIEITKKTRTEVQKRTLKTPLKTDESPIKRTGKRQMTGKSAIKGVSIKEPASALPPREPQSATKDLPSPQLPAQLPAQYVENTVSSPIVIQLYTPKEEEIPSPIRSESPEERGRGRATPVESESGGEVANTEGFELLEVVKEKRKPRIPMHLVSPFLYSTPSYTQLNEEQIVEHEEEASPLPPSPPSKPIQSKGNSPTPVQIRSNRTVKYKTRQESSAIHQALQEILQNRLKSKDLSPIKRNPNILETLEQERKQRIAKDMEIEQETDIRPWSLITPEIYSGNTEPKPEKKEVNVDNIKPGSQSPGSKVRVTLPKVTIHRPSFSVPSESTPLPPPTLDIPDTRPTQTPPLIPRLHTSNLTARSSRSTPPTDQFDKTDVKEHSQLRITRRSNTARTVSSERNCWTPVTERTEEGLAYYISTLGNPVLPLDLARFPPVRRLLPSHVILMALRLGIQASMQTYESMESDLVYIAYIHLTAQTPPNFPLLDFPSIAALPLGSHPGDIYFQMVLANCRRQREKELRRMAKGERARNVVERSWLPFKRDNGEVYRRNFMTGEEIGSKTLLTSRHEISGKQIQTELASGQRSIGCLLGMKLTQSSRHLPRSSV